MGGDPPKRLLLDSFVAKESQKTCFFRGGVPGGAKKGGSGPEGLSKRGVDRGKIALQG